LRAGSALGSRLTRGKAATYKCAPVQASWSRQEIHTRREDRKTGEGFDQFFRSESLSGALSEYRASFRPLLDDSDWLFPSMLSPGAAISEQQIGRLFGDRTENIELCENLTQLSETQ
jgi:hypothetical protein